jgi:protein SCO1/2
MKRSILIWVVGGILGVVLLLAGRQVVFGTYTYQGSTIDPPVPAADFELVNQYGEPFRLSEQRGNVVLIFFGYTNCPDVCPVTLSDFKYISDRLGEKAQQVRFVFITVDPERDTPERLAMHLANFDPDFIGLTADRENLGGVWRDYGVYQEKQDTGSAAGYLVNHTARTYAVDKLGNLRLTYPFEMDRRAILEDVRHLIIEE